MALIPILPIFHKFNRRFFEGLLVREQQSLVSARWSDGKLTSTAGFYQRNPNFDGPRGCQIVLSKPVLGNLPISAVESTLCHEMIHAWIDLILKVREGHGPIFQKKMNLINSVQNDFQITIRHNFPVKGKSYKWLAICPICGMSSPYKRLVKGAACRNCCTNIYGGKWNIDCVLSYEPLSEQ